jgi:GxxExxY protein
MIEDIETIATDIVDAAIKVHKVLGPGLLESAYQYCLAFELRKRNHFVLTEVSQPVQYEDQLIDAGYRIDMLIDNLVIIENKVVDSMQPIHEAQILTYLKLSKCHLGFLLNWNVRLMKNGIRRVVNNLPGPNLYPKRNLSPSQKLRVLPSFAVDHSGDNHDPSFTVCLPSHTHRTTAAFICILGWPADPCQARRPDRSRFRRQQDPQAGIPGC